VHIVVVDSKESTSLAAESVLQREAGATSVTLVSEVDSALSISDDHVVKPLILGKIGAGESVRYG
jgi:glutamine phosphoribosylpyrophosphate amidotransferase